MTEHDDLNDIPQATVVPRRRRRFSAVWIIPLVAALVALGIAVQRILSEGPTITIVFKKAEGIEAGKTFIKYKDVNIGVVTNVKLSGDFAQVVVTAKIDKSAGGLMVEDAKFWVEQPRVTLSGISGIGTLLTGNYIGLERGTSDKVRDNFIGLEVPPAVAVDQVGRRFVLQADNLGSIVIGSPLYFRRLTVGQVIGYDLAEDGRSILVKVFVRAPYDKYVTDDTLFWQASGFDVSLGASGITVQAQSLLSMLIGGIVFEAPPFGTGAKTAAPDTVFPLYGDRAAAETRRDASASPYVLYFNESLRGLSVGAPVTYLGLPVGEVTRIGLEYDSATESIHPRVDIAVYPARFREHLKNPTAADRRIWSEKERRNFLQRMIDRGLRAQLRSGNLATGQLYVAFDRFPGAPRVKLDWTRTPPELPVMPGRLHDLEARINSILGKIDKMPLDAIGEDVRRMLAGLDGTMRNADRMLSRIEGEIVPEAKTAMEDLRRAIAAAERVLAGADKTLVGRDAPAQQELRDALREIARAARAIGLFTEYLERNPEALIRGKAEEKP